MMHELGWEEQRLIDFLGIAIKEDDMAEEWISSLLPVKNWTLFIELANKHGVLSLLYKVLKKTEVPAPVLANVKRQTHQTIRQNYRLLYVTNYLVKKLQKEDIQVIVLKGVSTAFLYPEAELRKSGDVDLFLGEGRNYDKACSLLSEWGFKRKEKQTSNHHMVYESKEGIEIELHSMLVEPFADKKMNEYLKQVGEELYDQVEYKEILGSELPVLKDGYHGFYLLIHMLQHFLLAGFGLKLLCDWIIILQKDWSEEETEKLLSLLRRTGLAYFAGKITSLCIEYFDLDREKAEFLLVKEDQEEAPEPLLKEIMKSGEFGKSEKDRLVNLHDTSLWGLIKEFHHQMNIKYSRLGKIFILWPVLWGLTLIQFVYNNWKIRRVSVVSVIKKAYHRSRLVKSMRLFEREEQ